MVHCFRYELWPQIQCEKAPFCPQLIEINAIALAKTQNFKNKCLFFCKIVPLLTHLAASSVSAAPASSLVSAWWWWWWGSPALSSRLASATACTSGSYWIALLLPVFSIVLLSIWQRQDHEGPGYLDDAAAGLCLPLHPLLWLGVPPGWC